MKQLFLTFALLWVFTGIGLALDPYPIGDLKPIDSETKLKPGDVAPNFRLPSVKGGYVSLSNYKRTQNVLLSFVPAAFTPACSQQWPGYNIAREYFDRANTTVIGISVDNIPSLFAWIREMGDLWFPVLSDFWPHGAVAQAYGVLRSDGVSERALFLIDRTGVIRYMDVHDINKAPKLDALVRELEKLVHWRPGLAPLYRGDAYSMNAMVPWRSRFLDSRPRVNPWLR